MVSSSDNDLARQRIQPSRDSLYGTMYAMLVITTIVFFARIGIRLWKKVVATSVDIWLSIAYVCFVAHLINYILATPPLYRQDLVAKGLMDVYPEFVEDSALARKWYVSLLVILAHHCVSKESARQCRRHCLLFMPENPVPNPKTLMQQFFTNSRCNIFANVPLFWATLWSVKMAFLMLYRKITAGIRVYAILWWITVFLVVSTFIICLFFHFFSCTGFRFFAVNGCISPADQQKSARVVYFSFAADVTTDIMILLLPLNVLRKLQRPMREKIGLAVLFLVGLFCPLSAVLRIAKLSESPDFSFVIGWLALWGAVETCVTIVVGCVPGMYVAGKELRSRAAKSTGRGTAGSREWYGKASKYAPGSRGYNEVDDVAQERVIAGAKGDDIEMRGWNAVDRSDRKREESTGNVSWYDEDSISHREDRANSRQASDEASLVRAQGASMGRAM